MIHNSDNDRYSYKRHQLISYMASNDRSVTDRQTKNENEMRNLVLAVCTIEIAQMLTWYREYSICALQCVEFVCITVNLQKDRQNDPF